MLAAYFSVVKYLPPQRKAWYATDRCDIYRNMRVTQAKITHFTNWWADGRSDILSIDPRMDRWTSRILWGYAHSSMPCFPKSVNFAIYAIRTQSAIGPASRILWLVVYTALFFVCSDRLQLNTSLNHPYAVSIISYFDAWPSLQIAPYLYFFTHLSFLSAFYEITMTFLTIGLAT